VRGGRRREGGRLPSTEIATSTAARCPQDLSGERWMGWGRDVEAAASSQVREGEGGGDAEASADH